MQDEIKFMLDSVFNYIPARKRTIFGIGYNEEITVDADEFWWKECNDDNEGYLMVWYKDGEISTHHTYNFPPEI
jgi:hypothetical protein